MSVAVSPPHTVGQNPIPSTPPLSAIPRAWSSVRLRALSTWLRNPVCEATTGRVAMASTSSTVADDACATSTSIDRASIRRIISRPASVRPPFSTPCADPRERVVEEMRRASIRNPASATTSTFAGSSSSACAPSIARTPAGDARAFAAIRAVGREVGGRAQDPQPASGPGREPVRPRREVQRPRQEPSPGRGRPAQRDGEQDHVVARIVVALDVEVARRLGRGGQDLQRDIALDQPRHVDVAACAALEEVAPPQQRVGVEVRDPKLGVQGARPVGRDVRRGGAGDAQPRLGPADRPAAAGLGGQRQRRRRGCPERARGSDPRGLVMGWPGPCGPRRGRPASGHPARARRARSRAARLRSRARWRAPGGASRWPRCRGAGRP